MTGNDDDLDRARVAEALNCPICRGTVRPKRVTHERAFFICENGGCVEFALSRAAGIPRVLSLISEFERSVNHGRKPAA